MSSTNHCVGNLLHQKLLMHTDMKTEPCHQYLDNSVQAAWTFYKPSWENMKAQISNRIAGKGRKYTGDQDLLCTHVAWFSDSAETHCWPRLLILFLSVNSVLHFLFHSLGTKSCFEWATRKGASCFSTVPHSMSWSYFHYPPNSSPLICELATPERITIFQRIYL